jgi:membrane-bound serine protease (ClpP class)
MTLISVAVLSVGLKVILRTRKRAVSTGAEALRNATGEVVSWSETKGEVHAAGSVWKARSASGQVFKKGDKVKVHDIDGLCLIVEPVHSS